MVTTGMAAKLRGKLGFATSLGCGEIGRVALRPLTRRHYATGATDIDNDMSLSLKWRIGFRQETPPRVVSFNEEIIPPSHSDAMGVGHICVKWRYMGGADCVSHKNLPLLFMLLEYETVNITTSMVVIAEFEISATILAACIIAAPTKKVRACINLSIDNNTAPHAVISGNSKSEIRIKLPQFVGALTLAKMPSFGWNFRHLQPIMATILLARVCARGPNDIY